MALDEDIQLNVQREGLLLFSSITTLESCLSLELCRVLA